MNFLPRLYFPLLLLIAAVYAWHPIAGGDDFWAHAAIGRWVLENGHAPQSTLFLWSADVPWVFHSYLSGVWFALILKAFGPFGALVWNVFMAALPFALLWRFSARRGPISSLHALFFALGIYVSAVRFHLRPEMFTALFLTLVLLFLLAEKRPRWQFAGMLVLFGLWPNLHAGVLLGIVFLWIGALANCLQNRRLEKSLLLLAAVCSVVPWLCNPYGFGYLHTYSDTATVAQNVVEWLPFWKSPILTREIAAGMLFLLGSALVLQILAPKRRFAALGASLLMTILFLQSRRQLWLASVVSLAGIGTASPLLSGPNLYELLKRQIIELPPPMRAIGRVGTLLILGGVLICAPTPKWEAVSSGAPVKMSRFLIEKAPRGRIFNDYESSAALEWFLEGKREIYIDLINAYPAQMLSDYVQLLNAKPKYLKTLDEQNIALIALRPLKNSRDNEPLKPFAAWLQKSKDWVVIYNESDGRVWQRVSARAKK